MKHILCMIMICLGLPLAYSQEEETLDVRVKGFVDTYQALQTDKPNKWMSSRTRARGEINIEKGNAGAFLVVTGG